MIGTPKIGKLRELRELNEESYRLKRLISSFSLDKAIRKIVLSEKLCGL